GDCTAALPATVEDRERCAARSSPDRFEYRITLQRHLAYVDDFGRAIERDVARVPAEIRHPARLECLHRRLPGQAEPCRESWPDRSPGTGGVPGADDDPPGRQWERQVRARGLPDLRPAHRRRLSAALATAGARAMETEGRALADPPGVAPGTGRGERAGRPGSRSEPCADADADHQRIELGRARLGAVELDVAVAVEVARVGTGEPGRADVDVHADRCHRALGGFHADAVARQGATASGLFVGVVGLVVTEAHERT